MCDPAARGGLAAGAVARAWRRRPPFSSSAVAQRAAWRGAAARAARRRGAHDGGQHAGRVEVAGGRRELERSSGARSLGPAAGEASRCAAGGGLSADCAAPAGACWTLLGPMGRPIFFVTWRDEGSGN